MSLVWDWETRSVVDIKTAGAHVYAAHESTDALLASFMLTGTKAPSLERHVALAKSWTGNGGSFNTIHRWKRGEPCPPFVAAYIEAGGEISASNAAFERLIFKHVMTRKHGWPEPRLEQYRCIAVTAAAMGLPRDLDRLGTALGLKTQKDKAGKALMKIHSIPIGFNADGSPVWHEKCDDPQSLELYHRYCDDDVRAECEAAERLIPLSNSEMKTYWMSERINDRGLRIDVESARAALRLADKAKQGINAELAALTGGKVSAVTQVARLKDWCAAQGLPVTTLGKDDIDDLLHCDDLPPLVERALELRAEGAKPSVDKIAAMLKGVDADGRVRGVYLHHGAGQTGRFSSRRVQAHNMPRYRKEFEDAHLDLAPLFDAIRTGEPAMLEMMYGKSLGRPLHLLSDAVRSFIWAAPGHEMLVADYSSIEGRLAVWAVGEDWKIEAYKALDRGEGFGIYELNAAGIYGIDVREVGKDKRQTGKVAELALFYQGGVGALSRMARANKLKLPGVYAAIWAAMDDDSCLKAESRFKERIGKHDATAESLGRDGWIAGELIKVGWRRRHPKTVEAWHDVEDAAIRAVESPGSVQKVFNIAFVVAHGFLWMRLPSGRCLAYGMPEMREVEAPWADKTLDPALREKKRGLTVRAIDSTEKWTRFPIYGGALFNNWIQGMARDILCVGMQNAEAAGLPVVGHTHDEVFCEIPTGSYPVKQFEKLLCDLPEWTAGLPLTAAGFVSKRYRKM